MGVVVLQGLKVKDDVTKPSDKDLKDISAGKSARPRRPAGTLEIYVRQTPALIVFWNMSSITDYRIRPPEVAVLPSL